MKYRATIMSMPAPPLRSFAARVQAGAQCVDEWAMHIASSNLQLQSAHTAVDVRTVTQRVEIIPPQTSTRDSVSNAASTSLPGQCSCYEGSDDGLSPALSFIRGLLERMFGESIEIADLSNVGQDKPLELQSPAQASARPVARGGAIVEYSETRSEREHLAFRATGTVRLSDGREFAIDLSLDAQREHTERFDVSIRIGEAARMKDPLVLNLSGTRVTLAADRVRFDLDADGKLDEFASLASGNYFLALDRNDNGQIDSGHELFGARTGQGFSELATHDSDGNGWIDANDPAWAKLTLWRPGEAARSLSAAGIGAIGLANAATPFELKDSQSQLQGRLRDSGVFLQESGVAGFIQQIDLSA